MGISGFSVEIFSIYQFSHYQNDNLSEFLQHSCKFFGFRDPLGHFSFATNMTNLRELLIMLSCFFQINNQDEDDEEEND